MVLRVKLIVEGMIRFIYESDQESEEESRGESDHERIVVFIIIVSSNIRFDIHFINRVIQNQSQLFSPATVSSISHSIDISYNSHLNLHLR